MDDQMPDYKCITCGWEGFFRKKLKKTTLSSANDLK